MTSLVRHIRRRKRSNRTQDTFARNFGWSLGVKELRMIASQVVLAALLSAATCAAENAAVGKWSCCNVTDAGQRASWTLLVRNSDNGLSGLLTDDEVQIPLSEMKLGENDFSFRFEVNAKPYIFHGKITGSQLEGKYKGEEASGQLSCTRGSGRST